MGRILMAAVMVGAVASASAGEVDDLRAENARLRERIEALERENDRLRRIGPAPERVDDATAAELVIETEGPDGAVRTTAHVPLVVTAGTRADHALDLATDAGGVRATFRTWFSGRIHQGVTAVELDVDQQTFRLPVAAYAVTPLTTGPPQRRRRQDHERVSVVLPPEVLAAAATAHSVGGRIGRVRFVVEPRAQATLRAFQLRAAAGDAP